jgi:phenylacetate-coenzyme A ligase PaaK-like adenylate-forming protein
VRWAEVDAFLASGRFAEPYLGRYLVWQSSGTSGIPVVILQDSTERTVSDILHLTRGLLSWLSWRDLARFIRQGRRAAVVLVGGGHFATFVAIEHVRRTHPGRRSRTLTVSLRDPLGEQVRALNEFRPSLLGGYASALTMLAHEQAAGRLHIRPLLAVSGAETLTAAMRSRIETAFGCPVRQTYASAEASLAYECAARWLHVNADRVIVEPVDEDNGPAPPGQPSNSVLITSLSNRVQPIIRYDLRDQILANPEPCVCGNPSPAIRVDGRSGHILTFPTSDGRTVRFSSMAFYGEALVPGVRRHQIVQVDPARVRVRLDPEDPVKADALWSSVRERLHAVLAAQGCTTVAVERAAEPPAVDPRTGKFTPVLSEMKPASISLP